nr:hypothetical protein [Pseudoalteromonas sp. S4741]
MIEIMRVRKLLSQQQSILSKIALGAPLDEVLQPMKKNALLPQILQHRHYGMIIEQWR